MKAPLIIICFFILAAACNKSNNGFGPANNGLVLDRIVKTMLLNTIEVSETIDYDYDISGRLIAEGGIIYTRDNLGRIINIKLPPNGTGRVNEDVVYKGSTGQVAYTICRFSDVSADSSFYERDNNGRIVKIASYYKNGNYVVLDYFFKLSYDPNGNLKSLERYAVVGDSIIFCGGYYYNSYDDRINPAYSGDEVRIFYSSNLFLNAALRNAISTNFNFSKSHTYRSDGRPVSCKVYEGSKQVCRLEYYYE